MRENFEPSSFLSQTRIYCHAILLYSAHTYVCGLDVQYLFGAKKPLPACQILHFLSIIYDQCIWAWFLSEACIHKIVLSALMYCVCVSSTLEDNSSAAAHSHFINQNSVSLLWREASSSEWSRPSSSIIAVKYSHEI